MDYLKGFLEFINPANWVKNGMNEILISILEILVASSYWICLLAGMIGLLLYIFGYEKGRNYPFVSMGVYIILNIIGSVILNV